MNVIGAFLTILLFIGGLLLFGYAFDTPGYELIMFSGGIVAIAIAVAIPVQFLNRSER